MRKPNPSNRPESTLTWRQERTQEFQRRFLAAYAQTGMVSLAARAAGISRTTHSLWLRTDRTYPARFDDARSVATMGLEDLVVELAIDGVKRPVLYQGKQVVLFNPDSGIREPYYEARYSDKLLIRLLNAWDPVGFGKRTETVDRSACDPDKLPTKLLARLIKRIVQRGYEHDPEEAKAVLASMGADLPVEMRTELETLIGNAVKSKGSNDDGGDRDCARPAQS